MEAEIGVTQPTSRGTPRARSWKTQGKISFLLEGAWPCQHLDFVLLAPPIMKVYISVVLSHTVCGNWLWQPLECIIIQVPLNLMEKIHGRELPCHLDTWIWSWLSARVLSLGLNLMWRDSKSHVLPEDRAEGSAKGTPAPGRLSSLWVALEHYTHRFQVLALGIPHL